MNELVNDGIKLSNLKINTGFINGLPKKWLSFYQSLRNTNHVKEYKLASLFGKLKYEDNLIDSIYESEKKKSLVNATPLSTAFFLTSIVQDFQDSPEDEEIQEVVRLSCSRSENTCKEQLLVLKQAKLDFLTMQHANTKILKENQNLRIELKKLTTITETYLNTSNKVNQCIIEQISSQKKRILGLDQLTKDPSSYGQIDLVFVKSSTEDIKVSILGVERPWLSKAEGFTLPNHDTGRILPAESQVKITDPLVAITDSSVTE
ncbi:hypothetical protein Tco_0662205 [Tanacetum coccineum]